MQNIVLDTNFIVSALRFKIDIEAELSRICDFKYRVSVLSASIKELERLINESKLFDKRLIKLALSFIRQRGLNIIKKQGHVDDILAGLNPKDTIIATQDKLLKKKLKKKRFKLITIRQKKYLAIEE